MTRIYDLDGTERTIAWLAQAYDGCAVLPARVRETDTEVWRLEAVYVTEGPATLKIEARRGVTHADNQTVALSWPALGEPSPELDLLPPSPNNWTTRGVTGRTGSSGVYGAGLGSTYGPFYHAWVMSSAPSDCLTKAGMKGGTNHRGPLHGVWVLQPVAPVDPDPIPAGDVVERLTRIEARLNALAAHLGA